MRKGIIYIIKNTINEKVYIGQTTQSLHQRWLQHKKPSTLKKRGKYKIYNAIKKYGVENFYIETLEEGIDFEKMDEIEIFYIEKFNSFKKGYNSTNGGDSKTISKIQDVELLKNLIKNKKTFEEIALIFKVNKVTVERTCRSVGIKINNKITKEELEENKHLLNKEIAEKFGVHTYTVTRRFKKYGIERGKGCSNHLNPQNQKSKKCRD